MIQAPEHLFLGIFSNEGLSWNLNIATFYKYSGLLLISQNFFFFSFLLKSEYNLLMIRTRLPGGKISFVTGFVYIEEYVFFLLVK